MSRGGADEPTRSRARTSRRKEVRKLERSLSSTAAITKMRIPCPTLGRGLGMISPGRIAHNQSELFHRSRDLTVSCDRFVIEQVHLNNSHLKSLYLLNIF